MSVVPLRCISTPSGCHTELNEFDRIFDNFFKNALSNLSSTNLSAPSSSIGDLGIKINVSETERSYKIEAELPGLGDKDVDITVDEGLLVISGNKEQQEEQNGETYHRVEHSYGKFQRSLQLPADASEDKVKASMKNGVLAIEIEKVVEAKKEKKRIQIKCC